MRNENRTCILYGRVQRQRTLFVRVVREILLDVVLLHAVCVGIYDIR